MDPHRVVAMRVAIEYIDNNRDSLPTITAQNLQLQALIKAHDLRYRKKGDKTTKDAALPALTVQDYRAAMRDMPSRRVLIEGDAAHRLQHLFMRGSENMALKGKQSIGLTGRATSNAAASAADATDVFAVAAQPSRNASLGKTVVVDDKADGEPNVRRRRGRQHASLATDGEQPESPDEPSSDDEATTYDNRGTKRKRIDADLRSTKKAKLSKDTMRTLETEAVSISSGKKRGRTEPETGTVKEPKLSGPMEETTTQPYHPLNSYGQAERNLAVPSTTLESPPASIQFRQPESSGEPSSGDEDTTYASPAKKRKRTEGDTRSTKKAKLSRDAVRMLTANNQASEAQQKPRRIAPTKISDLQSTHPREDGSPSRDNLVIASARASEKAANVQPDEASNLVEGARKASAAEREPVAPSTTTESSFSPTRAQKVAVSGTNGQQASARSPGRSAPTSKASRRSENETEHPVADTTARESLTIVLSTKRKADQELAGSSAVKKQKNLDARLISNVHPASTSPAANQNQHLPTDTLLKGTQEKVTASTSARGVPADLTVEPASRHSGVPGASRSGKHPAENELLPTSLAEEQQITPLAAVSQQSGVADPSRSGKRPAEDELVPTSPAKKQQVLPPTVISQHASGSSALTARDIRRKQEAEADAWRNRTDPKMFEAMPGLLWGKETTELQDGMWFSMANLSRQYFRGLGIEPEVHPEWCLHPSNELKQLFQQVWGESWLSRVTKLGQLEAYESWHVVHSIIGAAVKQMVYDQELPWDGPRQDLDRLEKLAPFATWVMWKRDGKTGGARLTFAETIWTAHRSMMLDKSFQTTTILPEAERLASKLWTIMRPQLMKMGIRKSEREANAEAYWEGCNRRLASIFQKALILKGLARACADDYEFRWVEPGTEVDRETMEEVHDVKGRAEVSWCVLPMLMGRRQSEQEFQVYARAVVHVEPKK
ncbi:hypothetical protein LTR09_009134 [Extremus antarcticus]|uniref:Uncharacterized protein n=1 Tax=Extremus antarcticus TaxID=702011 RepID=A0AAJ0D9W4_9PEZI|nr:hypothetical protein LTR09_009134 [Extremus antarcticus]